MITNTKVLERITKMDALIAAWRIVRRNGGAMGGDGQTAGQFEDDLPVALEHIATSVNSGRYRPGPLRRLVMRRPDGRQRILRIPGIADRVLQTAWQRDASFRLDGRMSDNSFGYRPGRSVEMALTSLRGEIYKLGGKSAWCLDADITRFFDQVPHARLLDDLGLWLPDNDEVALVSLWLRGFGAGSGLAQGSPASPLLANLFLHPLDMELERTRLPFVRYADDFVVLAGSQQGAEEAHDIVAAHLRRRGLNLNTAKTSIRHLSKGIDFLGAHVDSHRDRTLKSKNGGDVD